MFADPQVKEETEVSLVMRLVSRRRSESSRVELTRKPSSIIKWAYGEGAEGVFVRSNKGSSQVLVVGWFMPWWGMVIARLNLRIHSILLHDMRFVSCVLAYFGSSVLVNQVAEKGRSDISETRLALNECKVVAVERLPDRSESLWEMWSIPCVRLILVAHGHLSDPPSGWRLWRRPVSHREVGGVTDLLIRVGVYYRGRAGTLIGDKREKEVCPCGKTKSNQPNRDLRSVLKMAVKGNSCRAPVANSGHLVVSVPVEVRTGVLDCAGLLKVELRAGRMYLPRVRTLFGGNVWVVRPFTSSEVVAAWDVPEKLGKLMGSDEGRIQLMSKPFTPLKIRQAVLEEVSAVFEDLTRDHVRMRINPFGLNAPRPRVKPLAAARGPRLRLITPEEENAIIKDKSPALRNELLWPLSLEERAPLTEQKTSETENLAQERGTNSKVTKDDKASIRTETWDKFLFLGLPEKVKARNWAVAARTIRPIVVRHWRRLQLRKWIRFVHLKTLSFEKVTEPDREAARECLVRLQAATFWEWKSGSRPMFWNYPKDQQLTMRDGIVLWMKGRMDPWLQSQRLPRDPKNIPKVIEKLCTARDKGYIDIGLVQSLISFFEVPKGLTDIRMVYDGTKSGLNEMLWAPWFPLPTVDSLLRSVEPGTWMADNDVGEMFLNFILHESVQALCGVDLTLYFPEGVLPGTKNLWERWTRCAMGLRPSPYQACQGMMWSLEVIFGDRLDATNVFRFDRVELNLPGSALYNPSRPWVYKVRRDGSIAADAHCYVDDVRTTGSTEKDCWLASQRVSTVLASLGIQDAARKRRPGSLEAGPWKGAVVHTTGDRVTVLATQEKWEKLKACLDWMWLHHEDPDGMDHALLESKRGFLVHMGQTYPAMKPYFKGVHATLESWRRGRDKNGWKIQEKIPGAAACHDGTSLEKVKPKAGASAKAKSRARARKKKLAKGPGPSVLAPQSPDWDMEDPLSWEEKFGNYNLERFGNDEPSTPPSKTFPVARLKSDLLALHALSNFDHPPHRLVRLGKTARAIYGFGDASKDGFGASIEVEGTGVIWRSGVWNWSMRDESSNFREFRNLVESIERFVADGSLLGHELFMFTDNSTAEAAFFNGTSSSEKLFDLILRLRKIEMEGGLAIQLIHVAGTRMIWSGVDGLSRGDHNAGVMTGESMLSFVPLSKSAGERSAELLPWIHSWAGDAGGRQKVSVVPPTEWCGVHPKGGTFIWLPPPAAAATAFEWLGQSIHKRPDSTHIVLVPRLMTAHWRKRLSKTSDLLFTLPIGTKVWKAENHEPLICAVCLPLSKTSPWSHRRTARTLECERQLSGMWKTNFDATGNLLRKLLGETRSLGEV